ncbi:MAG: HIRAN domain-containing protein [Eggerthellaceae bacterium]|nr:HIRAN domain-containing protein [Eggerthellaceae bacterium]
MPSKPVCLIESTAVAGTHHVARIRVLASGLRAGEPLFLKRDARNPYDPFSVEVFDGSKRHLGYLTCEYNEIVSRLIDGGRKVIGLVKGVSEVDGWVKIDMAVVLND